MSLAGDVLVSGLEEALVGVLCLRVGQPLGWDALGLEVAIDPHRWNALRPGPPWETRPRSSWRSQSVSAVSEAVPPVPVPLPVPVPVMLPEPVPVPVVLPEPVPVYVVLPELVPVSVPVSVPPSQGNPGSSKSSGSSVLQTELNFHVLETLFHSSQKS